MQLTMPKLEKKYDMAMCLIDTLGNRRDWITTDNPPISSIAERYPRLFDYHGEMVSNIDSLLSLP